MVPIVATVPVVPTIPIVESVVFHWLTNGTTETIGTTETELTCLPRPLLVQLFFDLFQFHHVRILVMQVEEIHLVGQGTPVENAFFGDGYMIAQ